MSVIRAHGLKKTYASDVTGQPIRALDGAGIEVEAGEIFGILGPNGAGKTTLLNCLSLLLKPDEGSIEMFGMDALKFHNKLRARLNMSSGNSNFPWCMTVREILRFYGMLYGIGFAPLKKKTDELLGLLSLEPYADRRFDELSTGTKQRLALAKALLNDPEILFLDEPTIGLDPDVSIKLRGFIQRLNREKKITVLLTTHYMKEAEQLAQRIAFIQKGRILALGTPSELKSRSSAQNLEEVFLSLNA
ncbi:MAG: hypothetical protein A3A86_02435 [Elusimicrobia bacterium RIFCSPLOWO2_01_FULL_60_11]|nr:MAG: hypothetical protein A3A86_02435 [Elusimicrobia bacterium RIFCSPLOWO2_01_FULL_60_11]